LSNLTLATIYKAVVDVVKGAERTGAAPHPLFKQHQSMARVSSVSLSATATKISLCHT